jgi:DNA-binding MltR family transcriptional regulator
MASKGKKSDRDLAIDALSRLSRARPHPNDLWSLLLDAEDSLAIEKLGAGASDGTATASVGPLARAILAAQHTRPIPDATFALTITSAVEQALELAISTHFVLDDEGCQRMFDDNSNGPLSTFAAKIRTAFALGIYRKGVREELDMIRYIRNAFAHAKEKLDFSTQEIIEGCMALRTPEKYSSPYVNEPKTPKVRFMISARILYTYLEFPNDGKPMRYETHPMHGEFFSRLDVEP